MSADDEWDPLRLELKRILLRANARLEPEPQRAAAAWLADQLEALAGRHRVEVEVSADDGEGWVRLQRRRADWAVLVVVAFTGGESVWKRWELAAPSNGSRPAPRAGRRDRCRARALAVRERERARVIGALVRSAEMLTSLRVGRSVSL